MVAGRYEYHSLAVKDSNKYYYRNLLKPLFMRNSSIEKIYGST